MQGPQNLGEPGLFGRSEEHTSELQSLRHLVCRLLLEKKKHCPTGFLGIGTRGRSLVAEGAVRVARAPRLPVLERAVIEFLRRTPRRPPVGAATEPGLL